MDLIALQGLHAGTNIALDIEERLMPRGPMFPRSVFLSIVGSAHRLTVIQAAAAARATHTGGRYSSRGATARISETRMMVLFAIYSPRTRTEQSHYCFVVPCRIVMYHIVHSLLYGSILDRIV